MSKESDRTINRPGVRTTEFWVTLVQSLVGPAVLVFIAVLWLHMEPSEATADNLNSAIEKAVGLIVLITTNINSARAVIKYTESRTVLKRNT